MVTPINWQDAWGYHKEDHFKDHYAGNFSKYLRVKNISNGIGYLLSPIIGLIRIFVSVYFLIITLQSNNDQYQSVKKGRQFLAMEIGRGILELFCLGIFLSAVDAKVTYNRYHKTAGA